MAGMISRGMMCGSDEIGLSTVVASGIMDLGLEYPISELESKIGTSIFDLGVDILGVDGAPVRIPLTDIGLEIDNKNITNRPDLFGTYGHAREFATIFNLPLRDIQFEKIVLDDVSYNSAKLSETVLKTEIQTDAVLSYSLCKIEGITNRPTPFGMKLLLERSGNTSHDAVVDMTNSIMLELGQPMHAFDADTIEGYIIVRQARAGESIVALDGKTYLLLPTDIVIADTQKVLAIAGIMGGLDSGITANTKNICIESAVFDATAIRLTAQRLGLRSDASTRFEKSLDPLLSSLALRRAIQLLNFAKVGGTITGISEYVNAGKVRNIELNVPHDFIESRIGTTLSVEEATGILERLGFMPELQNGTHHVRVPSHRASKDISIPEDIVEEIGRLHGYDSILEVPIPGVFQMTTKNDWVSLRNTLQNYFVGK